MACSQWKDTGDDSGGSIEVEVQRFESGTQGAVRAIDHVRLPFRSVTSYNFTGCVTGPLKERQMRVVTYCGNLYEVRDDGGTKPPYIALPSDAPAAWPFGMDRAGVIPADPEGKCKLCGKYGGRFVGLLHRDGASMARRVWWCPWCSAEAASRVRWGSP